MKIILTEEQFKRVILKEENTSFYSDPDCRKLNKRKNNSIPVKANAYDIQRFLKELGYDIGTTGENKDGVDGDFRDKSAKAFASFYKKMNFSIKDFNFYISPINTLDGLYKQLKSYKYNVGDQTGFGPKMAKVLSEISSRYIKKTFNKENCLMANMEKEYEKEVVEAEKTSKKTLEWCKKNKSRVLQEIKLLWYDWADSNITKIKSGIKGHILSKVKYYVTVFSADNIKCRLEKEDSDLKGAHAYYSEGEGKIVINCSTQFGIGPKGSNSMSDPEAFKNTLLHEFTHYIDHKVDYINFLDVWKDVLPLVQRGQGFNFNRSFSPTVNKLSTAQSVYADKILNPNVIEDFKNYDISERDLERVLSNVKFRGKDYDCQQTEKEANLKALKLHFCNNLTCNLTIDQLKKIIRNEVKGAESNSGFLMHCWASNGFQPSFKQFLNGLNALALTDDKENNMGNDIEIDNLA